jgi:hypothetical protein
MDKDRTFTAFAGDRLVISAEIRDTLLKVKQRLNKGERETMLIFDDRTGKQVDFNLEGSPEEVLERLPSHPLFAAQQQLRSGPGRPKLGVISREISLLPQHWDWLEEQPKGISAVLRGLVDEARRREPDQARSRSIRDATAKFMWAMAGNLPGFEEASRALYAADQERLDTLIRAWPKDIRSHILHMLGESLGILTASRASLRHQK